MLDISSHYFRVALRSAERKGLDAQQVLRAAGVDPGVLELTDSRLDKAQLCRLWQYLWDALDDEFLGMTPNASKRGSFSMVCKLTYQCKDLNQLFREANRVYRLLESDLNVQLVCDESRGEVAIVPLIHDGSLDIEHFLYEYWMLYWHRLSCWMTNIRQKPLRAEFPYPQPVHVGEYQSIFQCPLLFDQPRAAVVLPLEFATRRPVRSRLELYRFLKRLPADFMELPGEDNSLETRIRLMIVDRARQGLRFPNLDEVAEQLHMSQKTLHRKLRAEDTSYQQLKDSIRRDLVIEKLRDDSLTITEIAHMAGFAEGSSLNRMFKKWTGMSPAAYRDKGV